MMNGARMRSRRPCRAKPLARRSERNGKKRGGATECSQRRPNCSPQRQERGPSRDEPAQFALATCEEYPALVVAAISAASLATASS